MCMKFKSERDIDTNRAQPGFVIYWKVLLKIEGHLESPYFDQIWSPGENSANRRSRDITQSEVITQEIAEGIHVHTNRKYAEAIARYTEGYQPLWVLPVKCYWEDLVAMGDGADCDKAVFTKVTLEQEDYDKALLSKL